MIWSSKISTNADSVKNFPARFILFPFIFLVVIVKVNGYTTTGKSIFHQMYQVQCWQGIIFFIILAVVKKIHYLIFTKWAIRPTWFYDHYLWRQSASWQEVRYLQLCFVSLFVTKTKYAGYEVCKISK